MQKKCKVVKNNYANYKKLIASKAYVFYYMLFIFQLGIMTSCKPKEETLITGNAIKGFQFSVDTVKFDTVLINQRTITKRLIATNRNSQSILVKEVRLSEPDGIFRLRYNGEIKQIFNDILLRGNDSLTLLLDAFPTAVNDPNPKQINSTILLTTDAGTQKVVLDIWPKDVNTVVEDQLTTNTIWTKSSPVLLTKTLTVPAGVRLIVEAGTTVYAKKGVFLAVQGELQVKGQKGDSVVFRNDRLDKDFLEAPGQWQGIVFLPGSNNSKMEFFVIENASVGLNLDTADDDLSPELISKNGVIRNINGSGVLTIGADLHMENILIHDCKDRILGLFGGGNYTFNHCTFTNQNRIFIKNQPGFLFANILIQPYLNDDGQFVKNDDGTQKLMIIENPLSIQIQNSILWGSNNEELNIDSRGKDIVDVQLRKNIMRTSIETIVADNNILTNIDPKFKDPRLGDFSLQKDSPAIGEAIPSNVKIDLRGELRDDMPDIGAYEYIEEK